MTTERPNPNVDGTSAANILKQKNIVTEQLPGMDINPDALLISNPDNFPWDIVKGDVIPLALNTTTDKKNHRKFKMDKAAVMDNNAIYALVKCKGITDGNIFWTLSLISPEKMKWINDQGGPITDYIFGVGFDITDSLIFASYYAINGI